MIKIYETERLFVSPFDESLMTETYFRWFNDMDVIRYNSHGLFPITKTAQQEFLEDIEERRRIVWAVFAKVTQDVNIHIGNISLQSFNYVSRSAEFAVVIGEKEFWGKGYAVEALRLLISHGFNKLNLERIWTGTASNNIGMQKVAKKLGMKKEGTFKKAMFLNGEYVDVFNYGILKDDWKC